jgi:hypothetical protein
MKVIDVLRDDSGEVPDGLQPGECEMRGVGFGGKDFFQERLDPGEYSVGLGSKGGE